ncbi:unnamed protein product [Bursaphelenchus xylophilus]|uniref:(pine wood nematode) hypothetical protein n=1 Tax=Bursaphelenchus xylophilus TaxID=6326 RepID=A0A1I7SL52_BURXY|nr:unnamed protein product [Bursaphelenchus xylophilus]CAG9129371.1 unnamed protein product [Bursaphelenchus xylophilus]
MAWAETDRIGCALKNCSNGKAQKLDYDDWTFTACNYMPLGNVASYDVYIPGKPCSKCGSKGVCKNGLCVA